LKGLQHRPSPSLCRVGSHIVRFEACSAFTRVTACLLAELPKATLSIEGGDLSLEENRKRLDLIIEGK